MKKLLLSIGFIIFLVVAFLGFGWLFKDYPVDDPLLIRKTIQASAILIIGVIGLVGFGVGLINEIKY